MDAELPLARRALMPMLMPRFVCPLIWKWIIPRIQASRREHKAAKHDLIGSPFDIQLCAKYGCARYVNRIYIAIAPFFGMLWLWIYEWSIWVWSGFDFNRGGFWLRNYISYVKLNQFSIGKRREWDPKQRYDFFQGIWIFEKYSSQYRVMKLINSDKY